jgi:primase-polymerase (primpol)-like protein
MTDTRNPDSNPARPTALEVIPEAIPYALRTIPQWVLWHYELVDGRWTKVPLQQSGRRASSTDAKTWSPFDNVMAALGQRPRQFDGVGLVLREENGLVGIDLDDCIDPATGAWSDEARDIRGRFPDTYWEKTASGCGLRGIIRARIPKAYKRPGLEIYAKDRYLAMTGHRLPDVPGGIAQGQTIPETVVADFFPQDTGEQRTRFDMATALQGVAEGQRDSTLWSAICKMRYMDFPQDMALDVALRAAANCTPASP